MKDYKYAFLFTAILLPIALISGILVTIYQIDLYPPEVLEEVIADLGSTTLLVVIAAIQTMGYALICGFFGTIMAKKLGLWKPI